MTTKNTSESTELVPWRPPQSPEEFVRSVAEKKTNEIVGRSLNTAKYEAANLTRHLVQILPPLTGQYAVGCAHFAIERPHIANFIGDRRIEIEIYAPTRKAGEKKILMRPDPFVEKSMGKQFSEEQLQELYTYSQDGINPIGTWPIVIFSNGMGCNPNEYRLLLEQLASHGYLVLNLNHPSSSASLFENVDEKEADAIFNSLNPETLALKQEDNIHFIVYEIRNGRLQGLGKTDQIILAGHSLGGAASILAAQNDPRIKGSINLDGALKGPENIKTIKPPSPALLLMAQRSDLLQMDEEIQVILKKYAQEWTDFGRHSNVNLQIVEGIDHLDFGMVAMLYWLLGKPHLYLGTLKAHSVASQAMVQFMHSATHTK